MRASPRGRRTSSAVSLYVIILVAFQVFLITVAVEAFQTDHESLAWATAVVSVALAVGGRGLPDLSAPMSGGTPAKTEAARVSPISTLFPGYFALVMATGIVAIGAKQQKIDWLADVLYLVAAVAYIVLAALLVARLVLYRKPLAADLTSHAKGFAFLTIVAGTNVLGSASGCDPRLVGPCPRAVVGRCGSVGRAGLRHADRRRAARREARPRAPASTAHGSC